MVQLNSKTMDLSGVSDVVATCRRVSAAVMQATALDPAVIEQTVDGDGVVRTVLFTHEHKDSVVSLERWDYPPGTQQDWHDHPEAKSGHVVSGELTFESASGGTRHMTPYDPFYTYPGELHRFSTKEGASLYVAIATGHPSHGRMVWGND